MLKETLGQRIKEARKNLKMTQEVLAEKANIGTVYLGEIERGIKMPSLNVLIQIIEALNVSADYLLRFEVSSGKEYVFDELTAKLEKLSPKQRKTVADIIDAYIENL